MDRCSIDRILQYIFNQSSNYANPCVNKMNGSIVIPNHACQIPREHYVAEWLLSFEDWVIAMENENDMQQFVLKKWEIKQVQSIMFLCVHVAIPGWSRVKVYVHMTGKLTELAIWKIRTCISIN